jgi:predicted phosphohydrolase
MHERFEIPEGDVLIHAGDFMEGGYNPQEITDFSKWFSSFPHKHKILIAGNHDFLMEKQLGRKFLDPSITYLFDSLVKIDRLLFYGSPWTPRFQHWAFMQDRGSTIKKYWDQIPPSTDVLITHGPPQGSLDTSVTWGANLGCEELQKRVQKVWPKLHVFGHIHGGYGIKESDHEGLLASDKHLRAAIQVNAALLDEAYKPTHKPIVVNLSE